MYYGQAEQDKFVLNILKEKRNGYFLEIGSNHPVNINNTYLLESKYDWKGIMVEYDQKYVEAYKEYRPNSIHVMKDATTIDYKGLFEEHKVPSSVDYLQIDLEANNGSTIRTLERLDQEIFDTYTFATVTFEHDIYHTNYGDTRNKSREIFKKRGYVCVFEDINNKGIDPYEDWYVHPSLVDMNTVFSIMERNEKEYKDHPKTGRTLNWEHIQYM